MPDSYLIPNQIVCAKLLKLKRAWESFPLDLLAIPDLSITTGACAHAQGRALGVASGWPEAATAAPHRSRRYP